MAINTAPIIAAPIIAPMTAIRSAFLFTFRQPAQRTSFSTALLVCCKEVVKRGFKPVWQRWRVWLKDNIVGSHIGTQFCTLKKEQDPKAEHVMLKTLSGVSYGMTFFLDQVAVQKGVSTRLKKIINPSRCPHCGVMVPVYKQTPKPFVYSGQSSNILGHLLKSHSWRNLAKFEVITWCHIVRIYVKKRKNKSNLQKCGI